MRSAYTVYIVSFLILLVFISSCKKEPIESEGLKFSCLINGTPYFYIEGDDDYFAGYGIEKTSAVAIDTNSAIYEFFIYKATPRLFASIQVGKLVFNGKIPNLQVFYSYFDQNETLFSAYAQNGVDIDVKISDSLTYRSSGIEQVGSSFQFSKIEKLSDNEGEYVIFEATFNCDIIDQYGGIAELTNGYCKGKFKNM